MATLTAIIFDFDGVIADTEPLHFAGFRQTLAEIGISLTESDYYANYLGYDDRGCFIAALTAHQRPTDPAALAQLMQRKAHAYLESVTDHLAIFPGVREFVSAAAAEPHQKDVVFQKLDAAIGKISTLATERLDACWRTVLGKSFPQLGILEMHKQARSSRIAAEQALSRVAQAGSAQRDKGNRLVGGVVKYQSGFLRRPTTESSRACRIFHVAAIKMKQRKVSFYPFDIVTT